MSCQNGGVRDANSQGATTLKVIFPDNVDVPMSIHSTVSNNCLKIVIEGQFDLHSHKEFLASYSDVDFNPQTYVVDMRGANYLDSSALGMLLLLRDHAGGDDSKVEIVNCNPDVRKILSIASFEQLFQIH